MSQEFEPRAEEADMRGIKPRGLFRAQALNNAPLRLFLGEAPLGIATADYESRLAIWREWQPVAAAAQGHGR